MAPRQLLRYTSDRMRRWLARIGLAISGLAVALAACEVGFRTYERIQLARAGELWAVHDEELGWRLNPRFGDHTSDGLRDRPVSAKDGRVRILVLGDSVLYEGADVDDTIPGHLRRELVGSGGAVDARGVDVVNAGIRGFTNWQELQYLKASGLALEPDLVGVAFVLNDCPRRLHQFRVEDGRIVGQEYDFSDEVVTVQPWVFRTLRKSRFLVWLRRRLSFLEPVPEGGTTFEHRPDFAAAWRADSWPRIEAQMREMVDLGAQQGFRVFLVVFPFADQYREDYLALGRERVLFPQKQLERICSDLEVPLLDLYPELDPAVDFLDDKIHLTAAGRAKAAREIADFIERSSLLPSR